MEWCGTRVRRCGLRVTAALGVLACWLLRRMGTASVLHQEYPTEDQIVSECSPGIIPYSGLEAAISATRNWAGAVALWNVALDPSGGPVQQPDRGCPNCPGVVTISERTHTLECWSPTTPPGRRFASPWPGTGNLSGMPSPQARR